EDVPALLATCDLFVLPSLSEGLSIAILEAMSSARPVVTTRVGGNPELVVDGETGVLVAPADPEQLASAVVRTLTKPAEARRLGENGLNRVKSRFSVGAMVRGYEALYDIALRSRPPHGTSLGKPWRWTRFDALHRRLSVGVGSRQGPHALDAFRHVSPTT